MYLPKNKYRLETTYGGEYVDENGQDYTGGVIRTSDGTVFAGDSLSNVKGIVTKVEDQNLLEIERPYNDYFGPTDQDYAKGQFVRYFLRDKRNGKFTEVNLEQWRIKRTLKYVTAGKLVWLLKGPVSDGTVNGIPYRGTSTKNKESLQNLEKQYPGITDFFKSTSEFVR